MKKRLNRSTSVWNAESDGSREPCITWGVDASTRRGTLLLGVFWPMEKHCKARNIGVELKDEPYVQKTGGAILTIYRHFLGRDNCTSVKIFSGVNVGPVVQRVRHLGLRSVGRWFKSCSRQRCVTNNLRQVVYTYVPLSPSSITCYRPKGGDALRMGR